MGSKYLHILYWKNDISMTCAAQQFSIFISKDKEVLEAKCTGEKTIQLHLDRHIRVKVTTHALRCIDKAGGIDEYLLKTPYHKMDTETGLYGKTKIEKMYEDLGDMELILFTPEDESNIEQQFTELRLEDHALRREARTKIYGWTPKQHLIKEAWEIMEETDVGSSFDEHELLANV